jgi:hypothetical protein
MRDYRILASNPEVFQNFPPSFVFLCVSLDRLNLSWKVSQHSFEQNLELTLLGVYPPLHSSQINGSFKIPCLYEQ